MTKETEFNVHAILVAVYHQSETFRRSIFAVKMAWDYRNQIGHNDVQQGRIIIEESTIRSEAEGL